MHPITETLFDNLTGKHACPRRTARGMRGGQAGSSASSQKRSERKSLLFSTFLSFGPALSIYCCSSARGLGRQLGFTRLVPHPLRQQTSMHTWCTAAKSQSTRLACHTPTLTIRCKHPQQRNPFAPTLWKVYIWRVPETLFVGRISLAMSRVSAHAPCRGRLGSMDS
jgi:hypothetical protein